jgi:hypothetical protein
MASEESIDTEPTWELDETISDNLDLRISSLEGGQFFCVLLYLIAPFLIIIQIRFKQSFIFDQYSSFLFK